MSNNSVLKLNALHPQSFYVGASIHRTHLTIFIDNFLGRIQVEKSINGGAILSLQAKFELQFYCRWSYMTTKKHYL